MKKILLLVALAAITATTANAQWSPDYQGDVELGYSIGTGNHNRDRVNIHTTHGIRFNRYFFAGVGTGLDIYMIKVPRYDNELREIGSTSDTRIAMPVFLNVRGYLPVGDRLDIFAGLDVGYGIGLSKHMGNGLLVTPEAGIAYILGSGNALTFAFGYNSQSWSAYGSSYNTNAISLKLGFQF